jgi:phosphoribosylglycinamide formyltransferase-1
VLWVANRLVDRLLASTAMQDEHTLAARILEQEHVAYSEAIDIVLEGRYTIAGRRLVTDITPV